MEKKKYYVHLLTREVLDAPDPGTFSFEIEATDLEVAELRNLLAELSEQDQDTFFDAFLPFQQEEAMAHNQEFEHLLNTIYQQLYHLGTDQTKNEIANLMSINQ
jgi:hypothetical protein